MVGSDAAVDCRRQCGVCAVCSRRDKRGKLKCGPAGQSLEHERGYGSVRLCLCAAQCHLAEHRIAVDSDTEEAYDPCCVSSADHEIRAGL